MYMLYPTTCRSTTNSSCLNAWKLQLSALSFYLPNTLYQHYWQTTVMQSTIAYYNIITYLNHQPTPMKHYWSITSKVWFSTAVLAHTHWVRKWSKFTRPLFPLWEWGLGTRLSSKFVSIELFKWETRYSQIFYPICCSVQVLTTSNDAYYDHHSLPSILV